MSNKVQIILYMVLIGVLGILGIAAGDIPTIIALVVVEGMGVMDLMEAW